MGNLKLFWLNMLFPGFLSLVHTITDDFFYDPVFSHHEGHIMRHKTDPGHGTKIS